MDQKAVLEGQSDLEVASAADIAVWELARPDPGHREEAPITEEDREQRQCEVDFRQLATIVGQTDDAVIVQNTAGRIVAWNEGAQRMLGWTEQEALAMQGTVLVPKGKRNEARALLQTLTHGGGRTILDTQRIAKNGRIVDVNVIAWPLVNEAGQPIGVATAERDISEHRLAEKEFREYFAELVSSARLNTAGDVATELAEELSQPVAAIVAHAQASIRLLEAGKLDAEEFKEIMEDISGEGARAGKVVRRLKGCARRMRRPRQTVDVNKLIREMHRLIDMEARRCQCKVRLHLSDHLPQVLADEIQVRQIVMNLARNGIEATEESPSNKRELVIESKPSGNAVEVAVRDSGSGIRQELTEQVFRPFFTTKSHNIGLGLSVCRSIIDAHGGTLEMESEPGHGSTFRFTLPAQNG